MQTILRLALLGVIGLQTMLAGAAIPRSPAEEAYYQIEGNVFDRLAINNALAKLEQARRVNPRDPWVYMTASLAVLVSGYTIGDWYSPQTFIEGTIDKALDLAVKAVDADPQESQCHAHLARLRILQGDYKAAWEVLAEAYKRNPNSFYLWYFRGIIAEKMRDAVKGKLYFDEAEQRVAYKYQASLLNIHRQKLAKISGDLAEQERLLKDNIAHSPDKPHFYGNYAHFLMSQERYDEAIQYWQKAIELGPYLHALEQLEQTKRLQRSHR
jgi:tetratricopeptide (TPR) repeat protein